MDSRVTEHALCVMNAETLTFVLSSSSTALIRSLKKGLKRKVKQTV